MKKVLDTKYLKIALYTIFVIVVSILAYRLSSKSDNIMPYITSFFKSIFSIFEPIIYGLIIAYLMNPSMSFFERHFSIFFKPHSIKHYRAIRTLSILIVYICLFGTIILSVKFLIPQILNNLSVLANNIPTYINEFKSFLGDLERQVSDTLVTIPPDLISQIFDMLDISNIISINSLSVFFDKAILSTVSITGALLDWVIAFIVAIYALSQKETFINGSKRIIYALFKSSTANKIISISEESNQLMIKFFVGKSIDSLIIGIMCFVGLSLLKNPYALLLAFIVGLFNMIPYFGPFIGAIPAVIITLFEGLGPAVAVALFILALQQFDGLILGPKIIGDSLGITPFWIISGVTIGGGLAGALGMFFACPILAVLLLTINRWLDKKLGEKAISLPQLSVDEVIPTYRDPVAKISLSKPFSSKKKTNK